MRRVLSLSVVLAALLGAIPTTAFADDDPENIVKYRQMVLGSMGAHMGATAMVVKGEMARSDDLLLHAQALHGASKALDGLFPPATAPDKVKRETEALPTIWSKPDDFAKALKRFQDESAKLVDAAKTGDLAAVKGQFGNVGQSCGGCHDHFRKDDDH